MIETGENPGTNIVFLRKKMGRFRRLIYGKPICQYYEYYPVTQDLKIHQDKSQITVGYHGNKVHLMSMWPVITEALIALSKTQSITFKAIYNIKSLGKWELGCPKDIQIDHVQLDDLTYEKEISSCDVGIVPALSPTEDLEDNFFSRKIYLLDQDDYLMRFKMPSNAGRIIVFALKGVPVVADMIPSSCQMIKHGENGFLAYSSGGWYHALAQLVSSPKLRNEFATKLYDHISATVEYNTQNLKLLDFLKDLNNSTSSYPPFKRKLRTSHPELKLNYIKKKMINGLGTPI